MKSEWLVAAFVAAVLAGCASGDVRRTHDFDLQQLRKDALVSRHEALLAAENAEFPPLLTLRGSTFAQNSTRTSTCSILSNSSVCP
jgi:hypothetical protein